MTMPSIEEEIQQPKFQSSAHRAQVNILYTAAWLNQNSVSVMKPLGLSIQQFNVLRILRGRGNKPSTVKLLTERMLDKMSNASRLVDKLKDKGYVERQECPTDRRRVDIMITPAGLSAVEEATRRLEESLRNSLGHLTDAEFTQLSGLLDKMRG